MPEQSQQLNKSISASQLLAGRILTALLIGLVLAALFGDFFVWAILGAKFLQSAQFHRMEPSLQGLSTILLFLFMAQAQKGWKQGKAHFVLLGFIGLIAAGVPLAPICAALVQIATAKGLIIFSRPTVLFLTLLLALSVACKYKTLICFWRLVQPVFKPQDTRQIIISK